MLHYYYSSDPAKLPWRIEGEFKSPHIYEETTFINNQSIKSEIWTRVKE